MGLLVLECVASRHSSRLCTSRYMGAPRWNLPYSKIAIRFLISIALSVLAACGGGNGGGGDGGATYTIGGMVYGLTGSGLVLLNNAGDELAVSAAGAFSFSAASLTVPLMR